MRKLFLSLRRRPTYVPPADESELLFDEAGLGGSEKLATVGEEPGAVIEPDAVGPLLPVPFTAIGMRVPPALENRALFLDPADLSDASSAMFPKLLR